MLRQGQTPVFDFPLYLSEGANGRILKFDRDGQRTVLVGGLSNPLGIATDRANNLYVVEEGNNRLLKVDAASGAYSVFAAGLDSPSVVAVDSFGEVFVVQHGSARNVLRISNDGSTKVITSFTSPYLPTSLAFGVEDLMVVGVDNTGSASDYIQWVKSGTQANINTPTNISTDATGRIYVSENTVSNSRIYRFHQRGESGATVVAEGLSAPSGIAVDPVGNIYAVEQGNARVVLIDIEGNLWEWATGVIDPQYLAFTQY
ncbi:MAG: NHL repeat-containing protein [Bdellovibrionales bacterium]|nr:NHL repeat-containing protein [Bdellovibrionales bacterium]